MTSGTAFSRKDASGAKILVVRPDRLGDLILSTPVFEAIKAVHPKVHLTALIRKEHEPIIRGLESVDDVLLYDPDGKHRGWKGWLELYRDIRGRGFRIAVVLQSQWQIALALFLSRIRYRVGPLSKFHSFLFFNRGVRQRRSLVEMHEADYNLQLLRRIGVRTRTRSYNTQVHVTEEAKALAREWLTSRGWEPGKKLIAVHPGMGGSALNWPESHYVELVRLLVRDGFFVLLTGGPSEGSLVAQVRDLAIKNGAAESKILTYAGSDAGPISQMAGIYSWVDLVVAPSTGPLHLAVALGKPTVSFYPPVRVQSAIRWGPYLKDETRAAVLSPEVFCGEDFHCRGPMCNYFPCMKTLTPNLAYEKLKLRMGGTTP